MVFTAFSMVTFISQPANASPPLTGDKAFSNVSLWTNYASTQSGSSSSWNVTFSESGTANIYGHVKDSNGNQANSSVVGQTINPASVMEITGQPLTTPPALSVTVSSNQNPTDVGLSATLTATVSGGTSPYTYLWYWANGTATSNHNDNFVITESTAGTYGMYVHVVDDTGTAVNSSVYDETFNSLPSVSISASQTTVDVGQSFTLTATVSGGTSPYTYVWSYANGTAISGATASAYTASWSASGTYYYYCTVTDKVGSSKLSNEVTITVDSALTASISSSKNPIDYGQSVTFTATASGGSGTYTSYQWYVGGSAISGATSSTYTTTTLAVGTDSITATVTDSNGWTSPQSTAYS